jgi:hypothetical protein
MGDTLQGQLVAMVRICARMITPNIVAIHGVGEGDVGVGIEAIDQLLTVAVEVVGDGVGGEGVDG